MIRVRHRTDLRLLLAPLFIALGCSSSSTSSTTGQSGLAKDKKLTDLSPAERKQLCDWTAAQQGGYEHVTTCDGGVTLVNNSEAECEQSSLVSSSCTATVSQAEDCITGLAKDMCGDAPGAASACAPLFDAACVSTGADKPK